MYAFSASTLGFYHTDVHSHDQMPADALNITDEHYQAMMQAQHDGKQIVAGKDGLPVAITPVIDPQTAIKQQISALERAITPRRLREAILGIDDGWLKAQDGMIKTLRKVPRG